MDKDTLAALVARVEQATGPDRELDAEIAWLMTPGDRKRLGPPDLRRECFHLGLPTPAWVPWESVASFHPRYTASLDAALAPVPWPLAETGMAFWPQHGSDRIKCDLWRKSANYTGFGLDVPQGIAATHALALVAAALRARMEDQR